MKKTWIRSYGGSSAAGNDVDSFWNCLVEGRMGRRTSPQTLGWQDRDPAADTHDTLVEKLAQAFHETLRRAGLSRADFAVLGDLGVIYASTKGDLEDFAWEPDSPYWSRDPFTGILEDFLAKTELAPIRSLTVSNACSSGLSALKLAQVWLEAGIVKDVLILGADAASSFVVKGFESLQLITPDRPRPFAQGRAGFLLGEAAVCLWVSSSRGNSSISARTVGLEAEGSAVTRPSESGRSLIRAAEKIPGFSEALPDVVIAHGTGTPANDETEDLAFQSLFAAQPVWITGTKWCVGHTLGASSGLDLIAACEMLRRQRGFALAATETLDPNLKANYWLPASLGPAGPISRVMISSLGFGGLHAAALLELEETT